MQTIFDILATVGGILLMAIVVAAAFRSHPKNVAEWTVYLFVYILLAVASLRCLGVV